MFRHQLYPEKHGLPPQTAGRRMELCLIRTRLTELPSVLPVTEVEYLKLGLQRDAACVRAYLCVHQCVVEQYEPVVGEAPGVLQSQRSVAAFTHHATLRETQDLLRNTHVYLLIKTWQTVGSTFMGWSVISICDLPT